jgi:hypothetical protein
MILYKKYIPTAEPNIYIKFSISFNRETIHWATSQPKDIGYQLVALPVEKSRGMEISGAFTGFYEIIYKIGRQSNKRLNHAIDLIDENMDRYVEFFKKKGIKFLKKYQVGDNVTYISHEGAKPEHGTVSTVEDLPNGEQKIWVRYTTGGTGSLTPANKLS